MASSEYEIIKDLPLWRESKSNQLLLEVCKKNGVDSGVIEKLVAWERENLHRGRRAGLTNEFDDIFVDTNLWEQDDVD
jgi:hypothetical protein